MRLMASKRSLFGLLVGFSVSGLMLFSVREVLAAFNIAVVDRAGNVGWYTSLALNSSGNPVISYLDITNYNLKVAVCGNSTCIGTASTVTIDSVGEVGWYTSLALNSNGNPIVSYWDFTNRDLKMAVCGNTTCSIGNTVTVVDSFGDVGGHSSLVLNSSGNPVISYHDNSNYDLKVAVCGNPVCTSGNIITTVDSVGQVGRFTSLKLNNSGNPVISYYDETNYDLKVAMCGNPACTSGNIITTIDSNGNVGANTSLSLNKNGNPVIGYYSDTYSKLKVAVCGNPACTSGNSIASVESGFYGGWHNSLELDNNDNPVISYNRGDGATELVRCGNPTCTHRNRTVIVDGSGSVGGYTSLELDNNDNPVISYYHHTDGALKLAYDIPPDADTVGVFKDGIFYLRVSNTTGLADLTVAYGTAGDLPVTGDWDGNRFDTIGVYRSSTGFFFLSNSNMMPNIDYTVLFGNPGDTPFAGKWTVDMAHDGIGVYRNSNGILYQRKLLTSGFDDFFAVFGNPSDQGIAGDWDGDGFDSIGIYRTSNLSWYLTNNSSPSGIAFSDINFIWSAGDHRVLVGDWDGDGITTSGYLTATGNFVLHPLLSSSGTDTVFAFGPTDSLPVAGKWTISAKPPPRVLVQPSASKNGTNDVDGGD